jgi:nitrous oxidase accessory protein NosD
MVSCKRVAGVSITVALALMAATATASARTLVVQPGESIQRHVDRARGGDTVLVRAGTYSQSVDVNKGITLRGQGAVLRPGAPGRSLCNRFGEGVLTGICVHGRLRFAEGGPTVQRPVRNVRIRGFNIRGFGGDGVFGFGTRQLRIVNNRFVNNGGYGVFSLLSRGTHIRKNIGIRNDDFAFYVGDSRRARAVIRNNRAVGGHGGILIRDASIGRVTHNVVARNCTGIEILADAPGPASHWRVAGNRAIANNRRCAGDPQEGPPMSGLGIIVIGARDVLVKNNVVRQHRRLHPTIGSAGIAIVSGDRNPPRGVRVAHNLALNNRPSDIFWDGNGRVRFISNQCDRSRPGGVCS